MRVNMWTEQNSANKAYTFNTLINACLNSALLALPAEYGFTGIAGTFGPNMGRSHCRMVI